jgi:hypothetical protein
MQITYIIIVSLRIVISGDKVIDICTVTKRPLFNVGLNLQSFHSLYINFLRKLATFTFVRLFKGIDGSTLVL